MEAQQGSGVTRRAILGAGAVGAALVATGCSGTTSTTTAKGSSAAPASSGGGSAAGGEKVAATADVPEGGGLIISDQELVITQPSAGKFVGLSSLCPHQGCPVSSISQGEIVCPCHDSQFDLNGAVTQGPATQGLAPKEITVKGGDIYLA